MVWRIPFVPRLLARAQEVLRDLIADQDAVLRCNFRGQVKMVPQRAPTLDGLAVNIHIHAHRLFNDYVHPLVLTRIVRLAAHYNRSWQVWLVRIGYLTCLGLHGLH